MAADQYLLQTEGPPFYPWRTSSVKGEGCWSKRDVVAEDYAVRVTLLDDANVLRARAARIAGIRPHGELDSLTLLQVVEAHALDGAAMKEDILVLIVGSDKAEALIAADGFDCSLSQTAALS